MPNLTTAYRGRDAALCIGDGGDPQEYTLVAALRTNATTFKWRPDRRVRSMSIDVDGIVVDRCLWERACAIAVKWQFVPVQVEYRNGDVFEFDAVSPIFSRYTVGGFSTTFESRSSEALSQVRGMPDWKVAPGG